MKENKNYKILELNENVTEEEIKEAYKKLTKKLKRENNEKKLNDVKKAYNNLMTKPEIKEKSEEIIESNEEEEHTPLLDAKRKEQLIIFIAGLAIGLLTMILFYPDRIAKLKNGEEVAITIGKTKITADEMYEDLKDKYSLNSIIEIIDRTILDKKYELTEEDLKTVENTAKNYIDAYMKEYEITEEEALIQVGFKNYDEFVDYLKIDYKRNKYYNDYLNSIITDEEKENYYNTFVFGTINTEHILVKTGVDAASAEAKAKEILDKLKSGVSWDNLKETYKNEITTETVPVEFDSGLETAYMTEAKNLKDGEYSQSLVKTAYGYHIILRKSTEEKKSIKDLDERIKKGINANKAKEDANLYEKVMIHMREEAKTEFKDTKLKEVYENHTKNYN